MAIVRLWWADDSDIALTEGRLETLSKGQLSKWKWVNWPDEDDEESSFRSLYREITSGSMFDEGKVVVAHGLPSCHAKLSECIEDIPDGVVLIIIGGIAKNLKLYKSAKKFESSNLAKIDEPFKIDKTNAKTWIKERAKLYGGIIDDIAIKILFDLVGPKPNLIDREIQKMIMMSENKHITPFMAQDLCFYVGDSDVFRLCSSIIDGNRTYAHEYIHRLLIKGENHTKMCGYLMDWSRKLAIAEDHNRNYQSIDKTKIEGLQKVERDEDSPQNISLADFNESRSLPKQRLISNASSLYYICKELSESKKENGWGQKVVILVGNLILDLRKGKSAEDCFHIFVENAIADVDMEMENKDGPDNN